MESERCDDTSAMLSFGGLEVKPLRMVSSPNTGPRHTIDNILGLARHNKEEHQMENERSNTPGNVESAGNSFNNLFFIN